MSEPSSKPEATEPPRGRSTPALARKVRTCACGHAKGSPMIVEEPEYTLWGWILLSMFGVSPKADHVVFRCQICRQSLGVTRDPQILARRSAGSLPTPPSPADGRIATAEHDAPIATAEHDGPIASAEHSVPIASAGHDAPIATAEHDEKDIT